jgi:hypothetical protein
LIKLAKGILLSAAGASVVSLAILLFRAQPSAPFETTDLRILFVFLFSVFAIASISMLLIALPVTLVLSKVKLERPWAYPTLGFLTGCAVSLLFAELPLNGSEWLEVAMVGGMAGAVAGQIWWTAYRRDVSAERMA